VAGSDRNTATRKPKKAFYDCNYIALFCVYLGCLL
jgi:hypothetical protein